MRQINGTLKELLLKEEGGELQYNQNIGGENFQVDIELDKAGISMILTPVNPEGNMILNLSEEEINTLKNSLMTTLGPKFSRYKLELSAEDIKGDEKQIKISIPAGSIFPFIQKIISM
jgi:hypothetical protein